ncbi:MAG: bifunctional UDP-N-acetylmuramoyl-tripeptide:D-alanyl-D-alanine ligase/alanine racemase, partial [Sinomicrobium sp.]|nr:bifunctional UDP-N-acetylmuramoyl-tripeptide:D-alanyl-D-alanine ligase/alanine racemase [Sinomicrobium sp.]
MVNSPYLIPEISKIIQARLFGDPADNAPITYLLTDSRQVRFAGQSLFFALVCPHHDGHQFLEEAYQKGVRYFVISKMPGPWQHKDSSLLLVDDTLSALQQLCRYHRERFDLQVIGITGSNGKTTVKEWLFQLLQDDFYILRNPRSYNSQIGVPLSVWPLREAHQMGIFEAGISQPGEMKNLAEIIQPTIGLLTNIGSAHDAGFKDRAQKIAEKLLLFRGAGVVIYRSGERDIDEALMRLGRPFFSWSFESGADVQILQVERGNSST